MLKLFRKLKLLIAMVDDTGKGQAVTDAYNKRKEKWLADNKK